MYCAAIVAALAVAAGLPLVAAEGSRQLGSNQGLETATELFVDILDPAEYLVYTGDAGTVLEVTIDGTPHVFQQSGAVFFPSAGTFAVGILGTTHVDVFDFVVRDSTTGGERRGRLWSKLWKFDTGSFAEQSASHGSYFAMVPSGPGMTGVVEMKLDGLSGYAYTIHGNADGAQYASKFPLYVNPPATATYTAARPVIDGVTASVSGAGDCASLSRWAVSYRADVEGTAHVICDTSGDGVFSLSDPLDYQVTVASSVGFNTVALDNSPVFPVDAVHTCILEVAVGEFHYVGFDIETSFPGFRFFELDPRGNREGMYAFWSDSEDAQSRAVRMPSPHAYLSAQRSPPFGLFAGDYTDPAIPHGQDPNHPGNARGWGTFASRGKGNDEFLDTFSRLRFSRSAPFVVARTCDRAIVGVQPIAVSAAGGSVLTVSGYNFLSAGPITSVTLEHNGVVLGCPLLQAATDTKVQCATPAGSFGVTLGEPMTVSLLSAAPGATLQAPDAVTMVAPMPAGGCPIDFGTAPSTSMYAIADPLRLSPTDQYTFAAWIVNAGNGFLYSLWHPSGYQGGVVLLPDGIKVYVGLRQLQSNVVVPLDGLWHHVAVVVDGGVATVYLDGQERETLGSGTGPGPLQDMSSLVLGQDQDCRGGCFRAGQSFQGRMAEAAFWARPLHASQVATLWGSLVEMPNGRLQQTPYVASGLEADPIALWLFDECQAATLRSRIGNGHSNDLALVGVGFDRTQEVACAAAGAESDVSHLPGIVTRNEALGRSCTWTMTPAMGVRVAIEVVGSVSVTVSTTEGGVEGTRLVASGETVLGDPGARASVSTSTPVRMWQAVGAPGGCVLDLGNERQNTNAAIMEGVPAEDIEELTFSAWVYIRDVPGKHFVASLQHPTDRYQFGVVIKENRAVRVFVDLKQTNFGTRVDVGRWTMLTVTASSNEVRLYVDGELREINPNVGVPPSMTFSGGSTLAIGQDQDCTGGCFNADQAMVGMLDEIAVFERVLGDADVGALFGRGLLGSEDGLLAHFALNECAGPRSENGVPGGKPLFRDGVSEWAVWSNGVQAPPSPVSDVRCDCESGAISRTASSARRECLASGSSGPAARSPPRSS